MDTLVAVAERPPALLPVRQARSTEPNATLIARIDLTPAVAIFRIRPDGPVPAFEPGQYLALGITVDGTFLQRPYSTSSPRGTTGPLEFLIRRVPDGTFTPHLWTLATGTRLRLGPPKGLFRTDRDDPRTHLFAATGTGLAPFVSMVGSSLGQRRPPRSVVVHGVSRMPELAYRELLEGWDRARPHVVYRPVISRPPGPADGPWVGPVGRLDATLGDLCDELAIDPADTVAYVCGNPQMIEAVAALLRARGLPPEAVRTEGYWTP